MTDETVVEVQETKKEAKKGRWTYESAIRFLSKNGHAVGEKQVHLGVNAGIGAFGCADYLRTVHKFEVFNPTRK